MVEQTCPCSRAGLRLGDPKREPILDCPLTKVSHPCYNFPIKPVEGKGDISEPDPLPGVEKHSRPVSDVKEDQGPIIHAVVLG